MANFEDQPGSSSAEIPIKDSNTMQRDLMIRAGDEGKVEPLQWIKENSEKFRALITQKPELALGYSSMSEEERLKMLEVMERELYPMDTKRAA